jgi:hypothetical protein
LRIVPNFSLRPGVAIGSIAIFSLSVIGLGTTPAFAQTDSPTIVAPTQRLASYSPAGTADSVGGTTQSTRTSTAPEAGRHFWISYEGGIFRNVNNRADLGIVSGAPTVRNSTSTMPIPTAPGFIGLVTTQNLPGDPVNGAPIQGPTVTSRHPGQTAHLGYWFNDERSKGVDIEGMYLTSQSGSLQVAPSGNTLAAPNANLFGTTGSYVISQPATPAITSVSVNTTPDVFVGLYNQVVSTTTNGTLSVQNNNSFYTFAANFRASIWHGNRSGAVYIVAGVRYARFYESLSIASSSQVAQTNTVTYAPALGLPAFFSYTNTLNSTASTSDGFGTNNSFIGPQVGVSSDYHWRRFWIDGTATLAPGAVWEALNISGASHSSTTTSTTPTAPFTLAGIPLIGGTGNPPVTATTTQSSQSGIFAKPANSGSQSRTEFAAMPAASVQFGYDLIPKRLSTFIGYRVLYLSAATQTSQAASSPGVVLFGGSSFLAQGGTIGLRAQF